MNCNTNGILDECEIALPLTAVFDDSFDTAPLNPLHWTGLPPADVTTDRSASSSSALRLRANGGIESAPIDLSGSVASQLALRTVGDGGRAATSLDVEFWDGGAWLPLLSLSAASAGLDWTDWALPLPGAALHGGFRVRIRKTGAAAGAWFIDDVTVNAALGDCDANGWPDGCELDRDCDGTPDACDQCIVPLAGDLNCDGAVNSADVCGLVAALLRPGFIPPDELLAADLTGDGAADGDDLKQFLAMILPP
jgi:hypothetical protein